MPLYCTPKLWVLATEPCKVDIHILANTRKAFSRGQNRKFEDRPRPNARGRGRGWGQVFEAEAETEAKNLASRPACPRGLNITDIIISSSRTCKRLQTISQLNRVLLQLIDINTFCQCYGANFIFWCPLWNLSQVVVTNSYIISKAKGA